MEPAGGGRHQQNGTAAGNANPCISPPPLQKKAHPAPSCKQSKCSYLGMSRVIKGGQDTFQKANVQGACRTVTGRVWESKHPVDRPLRDTSHASPPPDTQPRQARAHRQPQRHAILRGIGRTGCTRPSGVWQAWGHTPPSHVRQWQPSNTALSPQPPHPTHGITQCPVECSAFMYPMSTVPQSVGTSAKRVPRKGGVDCEPGYRNKRCTDAAPRQQATSDVRPPTLAHKPDTQRKHAHTPTHAHTSMHTVAGAQRRSFRTWAEQRLHHRRTVAPFVERARL
jgi:hypothetical protein